MLFTAHLQNIKSYLLSSKGVAKGVKCIGHTLVLQDINPMTAKLKTFTNQNIHPSDQKNITEEACVDI